MPGADRHGRPWRRSKISERSGRQTRDFHRLRAGVLGTPQSVRFAHSKQHENHEEGRHQMLLPQTPLTSLSRYLVAIAHRGSQVLQERAVSVANQDAPDPCCTLHAANPGKEPDAATADSAVRNRPALSESGK